MERLTPFGKYFLIDRINVGGMAEVFRAKTVGVEGFEKLVAIKRILPAVAEDEEFIKMFVDEAKITAQLSHANLAQTFDLGKIDDNYYIAMEYVPGKDLRAVQERLRRRGDRVPLPIAAYIISRVCEGLDYAHRKRDTLGRELNIVHRDVSPQNVIVSFEGEVKLIDFGIAKAANKITRTQAGILKGKFGYMSPEQVRGLPLDRRSDIFAAGVVLYELCTGERLFTGSSDFSVLEKVQQAKITPPSAILPDIPLRLEQLILRALAREPEERYQHAAELAQDLTRFLLESNTRTVSRDDVAGFMKATFPDDNQRELEVQQEATRTRAPRREPPPLPAPPKPAAEAPTEPPPPATRRGRKPPPQLPEEPRPRARPPEPPPEPKPRLFDDDEPSVTQAIRGSRPPPPKLPHSLMEGLDLGDGPPETTDKTGQPGPPGAEPRAALPPMPKLPPLSFGEAARLAPPAPPKPPAADRTEPGRRAPVLGGAAAAPPRPAGEPHVEPRADEPPERAEDAPTRPMSVDELLAAERAMLAKEPPRAAEAGERTEPGVFLDPKTGQPVQPAGAFMIPVAPPPPPPPREERAAAPPPAPRKEPPAARKEAPPPPPRETPPPRDLPAPQDLPAPRDLPPPPVADRPERRRGRADFPKLAGPHRPPSDAPPPPPRSRPPEERLPAYRGRMQVSKPTLVGDDPQRPEEITKNTLTLRQRWIRRGQIALGLVALGVAAWAWLSVPHRKEELEGPPTASLSVTTEPDDAVLLLDGAQVKDPLDKEFTEPRLSAAVEHVLTARREGFTEQVLPLTLAVGEKKVLELKLQPLPNQLTVRSSPSGAQVFVDGQKVGLTPAYVASVDPEKPHAVVLEKRCFKPWQLAVPPNAGRREVVASLEPIPGACPGQRVEREEKPAPELPTDPAQMASIGFLSLGSRPSAQVFIDGIDIGRTTPLVQWPLKVGSHKIRLVVGSKKKELKLEVRSGQTVSEIVDLRKK